MNYQKIGALLGLLITVGAISFAMTVYAGMIQIDQNLAYMALYYDDMAVDLYQTEASVETIIMIQGQAVRYCDMYLAEKRTLTSWEYSKICDVVYARSSLFVFCLEDVDLCTDEQISKLETAISDAEDLGRSLHELRPYMSFIFSDRSTAECRLGSEVVPCPWTQ